MDDAFDEAGYLLQGICGHREWFSDDQDGDYYLTAVTNIQGRLYRSMGISQYFMHFELERHVREQFHSLSDPGFTGIIRFFKDIHGIIGDTEPFPWDL